MGVGSRGRGGLAGWPKGAAGAARNRAAAGRRPCQVELPFASTASRPAPSHPALASPRAPAVPPPPPPPPPPSQPHLPPAPASWPQWPAQPPQKGSRVAPAGPRPPTARPPSPASPPRAALAGAARSSTTTWSCQRLGAGAAGWTVWGGGCGSRLPAAYCLLLAAHSQHHSGIRCASLPASLPPGPAQHICPHPPTHPPAALLVMRSSEKACCSSSTL